MKLFDVSKLNEEATQDITCALAVFTPSKKVLLVHPTGAGYLAAWSLPKGLKDTDESMVEAAKRELREETSLDVGSRSITDHGAHSYLKKKSYHLFSVQWGEEIDAKKLKCTSTFEHRSGQQVIEVDKFMMADRDYALKLLNTKQAIIFAKVFK